GGVVPIRARRRAPSDRCGPRVSQSRSSHGKGEALEDHLLLRRPEAPRQRDCDDRPGGGPPFDQETRGWNRRGLSGRLREDGRRSRMAVVRHAEHVPEAWVRTSRGSWHERRPYAKAHPAWRKPRYRVFRGGTTLRAPGRFGSPRRQRRRARRPSRSPGDCTAGARGWGHGPLRPMPWARVATPPRAGPDGPRAPGTEDRSRSPGRSDGLGILTIRV